MGNNRDIAMYTDNGDALAYKEAIIYLNQIIKIKDEKIKRLEHENPEFLNIIERMFLDLDKAIKKYGLPF